MRICIYGAGVIGSILAGYLARAGHQISLVARGPQLEAIRRSGLRIENSVEAFTVEPTVSENPGDLGEQDFVIVSTKTPAHQAAAKLIAPLLATETLVGFAANGIFWFYGHDVTSKLTLDMSMLDPNGQLHSTIGAERSLGVVCYSAGEIERPGTVKMTRPNGRFIFGAATRKVDMHARKVVEALGARGIRLEYSSDIRCDMWKKFVSVASNQAISALTGGTIGQNQDDPEVREINIGLMREVMALAAAFGYDDLGFDLDRHRNDWTKSPHKPSMLQDLEAGRDMEIDSQYVAFQSLSRQVGLATPLLDIILPLLKMRARVAGCYA